MKHQTSSRVKLGIALAVPLSLLLLLGVAYVFPTASNQGYAPDQPIPFSHKVHAGDNKIACQYCHSSPEKSRHSTIPSLNVCMNCHSVVKTDSPEIQKVRAAYEAGKPIEWVRVHELPDYVYFTHKRHLAAGLQCETCHGDVKSMDKIYQKSALTMGWCIECHRGETTPKNVLKRFHPPTAADPNPTGPVAPTECTTCHN